MEKRGSVHKCTIEGCKASFSKNSKLVIHLRKHKGERPFVCEEPDCDKSYTNSSHLRRHASVCHGGEKNDQQVVTCEFEGCGMVYANKYSLQKHQKIKHDLDKYPFKCTKCSQGFHRKRQLQQHNYVHTGEAPFECEHCLQAFTTCMALNKHKTRHRSYTCECGEVFWRWSLILAHKKTCSLPKFQCHICGKGFSHSPNLRIHLAVHADQSKRVIFACTYDECKRFYYHKKNLTWHVNTFHKKLNANNKIPCTRPGCSIILKTNLSLKQHLARHAEWAKRQAAKIRRARHDKGKPKKSMASMLSGVEIPLDDNKKLIQTTDSTAVLKDSELLEQCDLTLTQLYREINTDANKTLVGQS